MSNKILIVDDNAVNRKMLTAVLSTANYQLIEAVDGENAIAVVSREKPDLILLDIMMPKKDGFEVCSILQHNPETEKIPIIFLSAKTDTMDKIKGLELGGQDYITKPFDNGEILARVRVHLKVQNLTKELIRANEEMREKQQYLDDDLEAAGEIQKSLLPKAMMDFEFMDTAWRFMPCQKVGGDLFNVHRLDETHWCLYMLDVSGHGVPSAMVSVSASQMLDPKMGLLVKDNILESPFYRITSPAEVLQALDQEYPIERFNKHFTISYMIINSTTGIIKYSNAAHPPPLLLHKNGNLEILKEGGAIIGMGGILPFEEGQKQLFPGDKIFMYTDGIIEYANRSEQFFGEERFFDELKKNKNRSVTDIVDSVISAVMEFGDNNDPQDDISLMGIEYLKKSP